MTPVADAFGMNDLLKTPHDHTWILTKHEVSPDGTAVALYRCIVCRRFRRTPVGRVDPSLVSASGLPKSRTDVLRRR